MLVTNLFSNRRGNVNGGCEIQPQAICVPITALGEMVKELREINNGLSLYVLKGGADK